MAEKHHSLTALVLALAALLAAPMMLGGCRAPELRPLPPAEGSSSPGAPAAASSLTTPPASPAARPPPAPRENHLSPATHALVAQARTLLARGDFDAASSTLDRALRIEPNNPLLWIELGRVRFAERDLHQAEGCARKALALASGDHGAQRQAGRLLADALRALGRNQEAREVESQAFMN
jgi:tetratricopeptide (TPR) repeat protein